MERRFDERETDAEWAGHEGELLSIKMVQSGWRTAPWRHSQRLPKSGVMDKMMDPGGVPEMKRPLHGELHMGPCSLYES